jgi:hypothetical protein
MLPSGADPENITVLAVDPNTRVRAPLANQPPFSVTGMGESTTPDVLVATGQAGQDRMMAISRDGGRTWAAHKLPRPATGPVVYNPPIQTDGTTLYLNDTAHDMFAENTFWFSTDDGVTWAERHLPAAAAGPIWTTYATTDGAHVVTSGVDDATAFWVLRGTGQYERVDHLNGLPAGFGGQIEITGPGQYVALDPGRTAFYRSTDGLNWTHVNIH